MEWKELLSLGHNFGEMFLPLFHGTIYENETSCVLWLIKGILVEVLETYSVTTCLLGILQEQIRKQSMELHLWILQLYFLDLVLQNLLYNYILILLDEFKDIKSTESEILRDAEVTLNWQTWLKMVNETTELSAGWKRASKVRRKWIFRISTKREEDIVESVKSKVVSVHSCK